MPDIARVALLAGLTPETVEAWYADGFFERVAPHTADWVGRAVVLSQLERARVPREVLIAADRAGVLARAYVFEFLQKASGGDVSLAEVVEASGIAEAQVLRFCLALGIDDSTTFTTEEAGLFMMLGEALRDGLERSVAVEFCELWGAQMRFIAQAEVTSFDLNLARPALLDAESALEAAARIAPAGRSFLRLSDTVPRVIHRRHLLQSMSLGSDASLENYEAANLPPGEVEVAIGFVDLTGYTALTQSEGDRQALQYARRLERVTADAIRANDVRIVKRLGDGIMFACGEPATLVESLLEIVEVAASRDDMPTAHASAAFGRAVPRAGDYYGHTVNVAARVLEYARASEVVVTDEVVESAGQSLRFTDARERTLKGVRETVRLWTASRSGSQETATK